MRFSADSSESFSNLKIFQNAIKGEFGSIVEEINEQNMLVSYYPMDALQNRWIILLMQPISNIGGISNDIYMH